MQSTLNSRPISMLQCILRFSIVVTLASSFAVASGAASDAQDWNRFRGPNGEGGVDGVDFPSKWTDADYAWKVSLPGAGNAAPVVWKEDVFVMSGVPEDGTRIVQALKLATGEEVWRRTYPATTHHLHGNNTYASSTPTVDETALYVAWATPEATTIKALSRETGQELWTRDLGTFVSDHGFGASPIIYKDMLILFIEQQHDELKAGQVAGPSRMIALDKNSGKEVWKTELKPTRVCYSVPLVINIDGKDELICCNTGNGFFSIDPTSGSINWQLSAFEKRTVASPLYSDGILYASCGAGNGGNTLVALKPGAAPKVEFKVSNNANYVPTPILYQGLGILPYDRGVVNCIDLKTGESIWRERMGVGFTSSPIRVGNKVYLPSDDGVVFVFEIGREFKALGESNLGEATRATPAIAGDFILFKTNTKLLALPKLK